MPVLRKIQRLHASYRFFVLAAAMLGTAPAHGTIKHYAGCVVLDPESQAVSADVQVTFSATPNTLLKFYLNKDLKVASVQCDGCLGFSEQKEKVDEYKNAPLAAPVEVRLRLGTDVRTIRIRYSGKLVDVPSDTSSFNRDWVELGMIETQWLPFDPESKEFTYDLKLKTDPAYKIVANAYVTGMSGKWRLQRTSASYDVDLAAGRKLEVRRLTTASLKLQIASEGVPNDFLERFGTDTGRIAETYTQWFGKPASDRLTVVLNPRDGASYSRPGYISLCYNKDPSAFDGMIYTMSHEVAHFWWHGASDETWENWLNEGFAEYTAMMYLRQTKGEAAFQKQVAKQERRVEGAPPLWGVDRHAPRAAAAIYGKGALDLYTLEKMLGRQRFLKFLRALFEKNIKTTNGLLAELAAEDGQQVATNFENLLKK
jgi:hypothetical protein